MKTHKTISTVLFLFVSFTAIGKSQLLKDYKFEEGGYTLLGTLVDNGETNVWDSIGNFYIDDISILNEIKEDFTINTPHSRINKEFHYILKVCKNGLQVKKYYINLKSKEISGEYEEDYFHFETKLFTDFISKFEKPILKEDIFDSIADARDTRKKMKADSAIIYVETDYWVKFEGFFTFNYVYPTRTKSKQMRNTKMINQIKGTLNTNFPGEDFDFEIASHSIFRLEIRIRCNKTLADKFSQHTPDSFIQDSDNIIWKPYLLKLTSYWKIAVWED